MQSLSFSNSQSAQTETVHNFMTPAISTLRINFAPALEIIFARDKQALAALSHSLSVFVAQLSIDYHIEVSSDRF